MLKLAHRQQLINLKISGLVSDLNLKAPKASPTFTGTVTVPTPVNPTDAVNKAYVDAGAQDIIP